MFADYHVHTSFSDDSVCPMEDMIQQAISVGLDEIAFTEHVDYGVKTDLNCDYDQYFAEIGRLKKKYVDKIVIKTGIEFGVQIQTIPEFQRDFDQYPFDFIILSNHQVGLKSSGIMHFKRVRVRMNFNRHIMLPYMRWCNNIKIILY